ncbi:MAG: peptidylprolyl isomerase [Victivallaceae bacterium]
MPNHTGTLIKYLLSACILSSSLLAPAQTTPDLKFLPDPVAYIDEKPVARPDAAKLLLKNIPAKDIPGMSETQLKSALREQLNRQIEYSILSSILKKNNITPAPQIVRNKLKTMYNSLPDQQRDILLNTLKQQGLTYEQYVENAANCPAEQLKMAFVQWIELNVTDKIVVSDEDAEIYYRTRQAMFIIPETVTISQISILKKNSKRNEKDSQEQIATIESRLRQGEDFNRLASNFNECRIWTKQDDKTGTFSKGDLPQEIENIAFSLTPGEVSAIITLPDNFTIIRLDSKNPAHYLQFEKAKNFIKTQLREALIKKNINAIIMQERQKMNIIFNF